MPRRFLSLSIAILTLFAVAAVAQTQTPGTPTNGQPFGGPILNTPNATFTTPAPEAGISDAGRAGISAGSTTETAPAANAADMSNASTAVVPAGTITPAEAPTNDMGVSVSVNNPEVVAAPLSVADAANRYKSEKAAVNARNLSNEDVEQIIQNKNGVTIAGNAAPQNTLPAANGQAPPAETQAPQTAQTPSTPATAQPQEQTAETTADNATTPQINDKQQSNDSAGSTRLPATATFLPLLGVMGLASGGVGLWFRKFRK